MKPSKLRVVAEADEQSVDITMLNRADIKARDWARCHIEADRRAPMPFYQRVVRTWIR
jgi:hypothetical protein